MQLTEDKMVKEKQPWNRCGSKREKCSLLRFSGWLKFVAQVPVLLITHHGRTTSLGNACSSHTVCWSPAAGARVLSLRKGSDCHGWLWGWGLYGAVFSNEGSKCINREPNTAAGLTDQGKGTSHRSHQPFQPLSYWPLHTWTQQLELPDNEFPAPWCWTDRAWPVPEQRCWTTITNSELLQSH